MQAPLFGRIDNWVVFTVMILYELSIVVRYMPNLWTRVLHGDLDYYKTVFYQLSTVAERELVPIFLEKITGKEVLITHAHNKIADNMDRCIRYWPHRCGDVSIEGYLYDIGVKEIRRKKTGE